MPVVGLLPALTRGGMTEALPRKRTWIIVSWTCNCQDPPCFSACKNLAIYGINTVGVISRRCFRLGTEAARMLRLTVGYTETGLPGNHSDTRDTVLPCWIMWRAWVVDCLQIGPQAKHSGKPCCAVSPESTLELRVTIHPADRHRPRRPAPPETRLQLSNGLSASQLAKVVMCSYYGVVTWSPSCPSDVKTQTLARAHASCIAQNMLVVIDVCWPAQAGRL